LKSVAEVLALAVTLEKMIGLINRYQAASKIPLLMSIDGEYGLAIANRKNTPLILLTYFSGTMQTTRGSGEEVGYRMGLE